MIIFDQSNDDANVTAEVEAFLRLAQAAGQRVIGIVNPSWAAVDDGQVDTPNNETAMTQHMAVLDAYNVPYVNGWALCQAHVAGGGHLSDYFADTAHWNATGGLAVAAQLEALSPITAGTVTPPASRVYADSADYEHEPVIRAGTDNDGTTGTWSTDGTSISSSEADATITFTGTFRKFACYRAEGTYPAVQISIDGGAFANIAFFNNGYDIGTRAEHTIVIKVVTACQIDEFWAI